MKKIILGIDHNGNPLYGRSLRLKEFRENLIIIDDIEENTMKINGFDYTESEVLVALKAKGYLILPYNSYNERHIHGSAFKKEWFNTKCAVKGAELPSDENIWHKVALKEFESKIQKPKLV
jgi:hypothetical protein